jgi:diguanylate cyclase (GGDEF)-like protein
VATELAFVFAIVGMNVLLGTLCLAIARGDRESPALLRWGWGLLVYTLGLALNVLNVKLQHHLLAVIGYSLIAWASVLSVRGVLCHTRFNLNRKWLAFFFGIVVTLLAYNHLGPTFRPLIDYSVPTLLAICLFITAAVLLLKSPPEDAKEAARLTAIAMLFGCGVWTIRVLYLGGAFGVQDSETANLIIDSIAVGHILATVASTFGLFSIEVRKMESALSRVAFSDALTNLPNRRATQERFRQEMARANRHHQSFAMLMIDIDYFKPFNDIHGHLAGDAVLKHIASVLDSAKRAEDVLGRIGGEEFVLILMDPAIQDTAIAAERLRHHVEKSPLVYDGKTLNVTISIGIAAYPVDGADWESVFAVADQRLYQSKQEGRNRVTGLSVLPA